MLALLISLSVLARLAAPSTLLPAGKAEELGAGQPAPGAGQLLGESPGRSDYELKLNPENKSIDAYPLDPSRAPTRQERSQKSVMLFRSPTNGAIDQVDLQPALPDTTPQVPYSAGRLSTQDSSFFGIELKMALKEGGEEPGHTPEDNLPPRAHGGP